MPHDISTPDGEHRFKFSADRVLGKKISGIEVYADRVVLHLDSGEALTFTVEGDDIRISLPPERFGSNVGSGLIQ